MDIVVQIGPRTGAAPKVAYRWDPDTDILSAQLRPAHAPNRGSGSIEVEGADGSWLIFDVADGHINGLEIVVWPEVHKRAVLALPAKVAEGSVQLPSHGSIPEVTANEVETSIAAESDAEQRIFHFRIGSLRESTAVRLASDLLLEVDATNHVAGLWLLNVPPFPREP